MQALRLPHKKRSVAQGYCVKPALRIPHKKRSVAQGCFPSHSSIYSLTPEFLPRAVHPLRGVLPPAVDLRECCSAIEEQGHLGCCTANALVGALEFLERKNGIWDNEKRFIVRNSWGTGWGMNGYFTMPFPYLADRGLSDDFWTIRRGENV